MTKQETPVSESLDKNAEQGEVEQDVTEQEIDDVAEELDKETETSEADVEDSPSTEETDEEEDSSIDEFLDHEPVEKKKNNIQRRIDQLTAQLKELKSENAQLRSGQNQSKAPEYTDEQLKSALKKAFEDGDHELAWEVMEYRSEKVKKDLINAYENEKSNATQIYREWNQVQNDYSRVWQDDKGKEIYPGAKNELNIYSPSSALYQLAKKLFTVTDDDGNPRYSGPGAQRLAVADAIAYILRKRGSGSAEKRKLERALQKEKRKKALPSGSSLSADKVPGKPLSEPEKLAEYIEERKKYRNERS